MVVAGVGVEGWYRWMAGRPAAQAVWEVAGRVDVVAGVGVEAGRLGG